MHVFRLVLLIAVGSVTISGFAQVNRKDNAVRSGPDYSSMRTSSGPGLRAPGADEGPKVDFRSQTILVQVPVVVHDKSGKHVTGLAQADFELQENGKTQKIAAFEEFAAGASAAAAGTPASGPATKPGNVVVIVLDTINTPFLDQAYARGELIRYLASQVDRSQKLALVVLSSGGVRIIQDSSQDPAQLALAIEKLKGELPALESAPDEASAPDLSTLDALLRPPDPYSGLRRFVLEGDPAIARMQQDRAVEATMRGFLDIAWALSGVRGRKSLIWATGGFPFLLESPNAVPAGPVAPLYERTLKALNDAQVSVYPVDVRGLMGNGPSALGPGVRGAAAARQIAARAWLQASTEDTLRHFAEMTGGRAFYNANDLASAFRRAAADSASYYLLSYYLDTSNRNPGWRKLKVKLDRKDVEVRSRNGFMVTNTTVNPVLTAKLDLDFAVYSPFESAGIPLSVRWTGPLPSSASPNAPPVPPPAAANTGLDTKKAFLLRIAAEGISLDSGPMNHFNFDVVAFAFGKDGKTPVTGFARNFEGNLPEAQLTKLREKGFGFTDSVNLPAGTSLVRFVVRDNISGHLGSLSAPAN